MIWEWLIHALPERVQWVLTGLMMLFLAALIAAYFILR